MWTPRPASITGGPEDWNHSRCIHAVPGRPPLRRIVQIKKIAPCEHDDIEEIFAKETSNLILSRPFSLPPLVLARQRQIPDRIHEVKNTT